MPDYIGETNRFGNAVALPFTSFATETPEILDLAFSADDLTRQNDMFWLDGIRRDSDDWENSDGAVRWINGFNVAVRPFRAHINGTIVYADQIILAVEPEKDSKRVDSVVIRRDYLARKAEVMLLKGSSGSGVPPQLEYNQFGVADYELARIAVSSSMVSLSQTDITDLRRPLMADFGIRPLPADAGKYILVDSVGSLKMLYSGVFPGKIDFLTVRPANLAAHAPGWYFCNGDRYPLTGPVGAALNALPANIKADFRIAISGGTISVPNFFYSDGRGYFMRAVNSYSRAPGSVEMDTIQQMTGYLGSYTGNFLSANGVFYGGAADINAPRTGQGSMCKDIYFAASNMARTSNENRSLNIGMTPAIYLGV